MKFRALLIDPGNLQAERPVQTYGKDRAVVEAWARSVVKHAVSAEAVVQVYECEETCVAVIRKTTEDRL